jgi:hypothetical protein
VRKTEWKKREEEIVPGSDLTSFQKLKNIFDKIFKILANLYGESLSRN